MSQRYPLGFTGHLSTLAAACVVVSQLAGCGGGETPEAANTAQIATAQSTLHVDAPADADTLAMSDVVARPTYRLAPVLLDEPASGEALQTEPHLQFIPAANRDIPTERLTAQRLRETGSSVTESRQSISLADRETALATGTAVVTYTPAQIRQAYGFPTLPASTTGLTSAQAADLGAGQTIYVIGAHHNPNIAAELAAFNTKFGLPACATKAITTAPAPAAGQGCELSVVYATAAGGFSAAAPAYEAGWATEMALDVQWAHATAPLARIVVVEATDASLGSLLGAIKLANAMGPGIVSMSLGANEGSWTSTVESAFSGSGMSYLAATGDSGAGVSWPAVSPKVLAVSGTSLTYTTGGTRTETTWSGTGGGISAYTAVPAYQTSAVPGMGTQTRRSVGDVSFNANPSTGQYVATIPAGSSTVSWVSAGGTSLSTPQWAGVLAIANAKRSASGKSLLGAPHSVIYSQIATNAATYSSTFKDITSGSNGACATCIAKTAYDTPTGLGTPNVSSLVSTLSGAAVTVSAPVVTPATVTGQTGKALTFTVSASGANPLSYTLTGAPSGMTVSSTTGVVTWTTPVAGTYAITVTAKDTVTGQTGSATYTVQVTAPQAPAGTDTTVSGQPKVALAFQVAFKASNPLTYTMTGAPSGMVLNATTGVVTWSTPVAGSYTVKFTAKDTVTGLTGTATYTVKIQTVTTTGPVITVKPISGTVGKSVSGTISITDPGATSFQVSITGVPLGMIFSISGTTITATWPSPAAGNYTLLIKVVDNLGKSATASMAITIQ